MATLAGVGAGSSGFGFQSQFEASADQNTGTALIGWNRGSEVYAFTFKGPLNKKTKEATPISLDGLSNGSTLQFTLNHLFWAGPDLDDQAEYIKLCQRLRAEKKTCAYQDMAPGEDRRRVGQLLHLNDIPWYLGGSGGFSVTKYNFLTGELKPDSETRTDYSLVGRVGVFRPLTGFFIASIAYQETSSPGADAVSLCQPLEGVAGTETCTDAVLKPPAPSVHGALVTVEVRRKLRGNVAMNPRIERDLKKDVTAVIVPVYFLTDGKSNLIGGVRGSWRSDTKQVVVSLFIGGAFALLPAQ